MGYSYDTPIDVRYEPHSVEFDDLGTPMLTHGRHPVHGLGWTLSYLELDGNGVDDHFIPGDLLDVDQAVESARRWLALVGADRGD